MNLRVHDAAYAKCYVARVVCHVPCLRACPPRARCCERLQGGGVRPAYLNPHSPRAQCHVPCPHACHLPRVRQVLLEGNQAYKAVYGLPPLPEVAAWDPDAGLPAEQRAQGQYFFVMAGGQKVREAGWSMVHTCVRKCLLGHNVRCWHTAGTQRPDHTVQCATPRARRAPHQGFMSVCVHCLTEPGPPPPFPQAGGFQSKSLCG